MEPSSSNETTYVQISSEQRDILGKEYEIAFQKFQMQNSQAWTTFSIVSTLSLAALAFVGQFKTSAGGQSTWPLSVPVGLAMIVILIGWLLLANRWWAYAQVEVYRMMEIETRLGMYLFRQGSWLRSPLKESEVAALDEDERIRYDKIHNAFPKFPQYRWRQQVITFVIVMTLIIVWFFYITADFLFIF